MSKWNWKEKREKPAFLALEDGTIFRGYSVGAATDKVGESVFNTGMTGYQEILSDPSYAGQFINMTYPEIGNYGTTTVDMEARKTFCNGFILHSDNQPSNFRKLLFSPFHIIRRQNVTGERDKIILAYIIWLMDVLAPVFRP